MVTNRLRFEFPSSDKVIEERVTSDKRFGIKEVQRMFGLSKNVRFILCGSVKSRFSSSWDCVIESLVIVHVCFRRRLNVQYTVKPINAARIRMTKTFESTRNNSSSETRKVVAVRMSNVAHILYADLSLMRLRETGQFALKKLFSEFSIIRFSQFGTIFFVGHWNQIF